jgi:O-antigen/teichoic acid export membrane protein
MSKRNHFKSILEYGHLWYQYNKDNLKNISLLLGERAVKILLTLSINSLMARQYGSEAFGLWSYIVAFMAIFQVASSLSFERVLVKNLSTQPELKSSVLSSAFIIRIISAFICWIGSIIFYVLLKGWSDTSTVIVVVLGASFLFQSTDIIDAFFQSQSIIRYSVLSRLIGLLLSFGLKIFIIINNYSLEWLALFTSFEFLIVGLALYYFLNLMEPIKIIQFDFTIASEIVKTSWPFMLAGIGNILYMRIDQLMVGEILGKSQLGIYAAAIPVATVWNIIPMSIMWVLAPSFALNKIDDNDVYYYRLSKLFKLFILLSIIIILSIWLLSDFIILTLYGNEYFFASSVLKIYIFTTYPVFMNIAQSLWITNDNKFSIIIIQMLLGCLISVLLNYYFLKDFGLIGAPLISLLSNLIALVLSNICFAPSIFLMQIGIFDLNFHKKIQQKCNF